MIVRDYRIKLVVYLYCVRERDLNLRSVSWILYPQSFLDESKQSIRLTNDVRLCQG
jgi:hypothetical protein